MIQKDPAKAAKWLKMAAEHGNAEAKEKLAALEELKKISTLYEWEENDDNSITITSVKDRNVKIVHIPECLDKKWVTSIGFGAFQNCENLSELYLPNTLQSIEDVAFYGCEQLRIVQFPISLKNIGYGSFYGCNKIQKECLPDYLQDSCAFIFDEYAFCSEHYDEVEMSYEEYGYEEYEDY